MARRKIILRNFQSPGDIVMLTAAVRDLHVHHRGRIVVDIRTPFPQLWEHNPYLTPLDETAADVELIDCEYPLIHRSNAAPWHFLHGFQHYLSARLGIKLEPAYFKGDIHLSAAERAMPSLPQGILGTSVPYWIICAGGKSDFTIKWWASDRFQQVVDHFRDRILFVQIGADGHHHPPLRGVLDLRGKTDMRQLVRLVYNAQGVLSPVTFVMHLAAAVEVPRGMAKSRPCVVVAGGREPPHWEAYPNHQFIHTIGTLRCCENGGCWRSRVIRLNDGDEKDAAENLCVNVVRKDCDDPPSHGGQGTGQPLPRCMDMISAAEVTRRIELYFAGGSAAYLSSAQADTCREYFSSL